MQGWRGADGSGFMEVSGSAERPGPPTIADVAAHAGVGVATVSRVFNGHPNVADPTRERVLAAIRELDYRPSSVARNLSLRCTFVIGVVVPFFTNPSAVERLRGIVSGLEASPYDLALFDVESPDRQRRAFDTFGRGDRADGLLVVSLVPPDVELVRLEAAQIPCVLVDAPHPVLPTCPFRMMSPAASSPPATCSSSATGASRSSETSRRTAFVSTPVETGPRATSRR